MADERRGQVIQGELLESGSVDWQALFGEVARVFTPNSPVSVLEIFAGRDNQVTRILDVIMQPGQHVVLFGERGVGKTSLANLLSEWLVVRDPNEVRPIASPRINCTSQDTFDGVWLRVLDKIELTDTQRSALGFHGTDEDVSRTGEALLDVAYRSDNEDRRPITPEVVRKFLERLAHYCIPIIVIDEFDRLPDDPRRTFADLVKMLSDFEVHATVVLVGVSETVDGLLRDHESVNRALVQVKMPRMDRQEIRDILLKGLGRLEMTMEEAGLRRIAAISQGLPYYAHLLGKHAVRAALKEKTKHVTLDHIRRAVQQATTDAQASIQKAYQDAIRSPQKANLFAPVLLACAMADCDEMGYFKAADVREPLRQITGKDYDIPNFAQHLREFSSQVRGDILRVIGEKRRLSYHFRDPLMQPFIIMQGHLDGMLPDGFLDREIV